MLFFLFSLCTAISQHLCVCQPDRPGSVCTLDKKCKNFKTEDQIILIEKKSYSKSQLLVNVFEILQKNKKNGEDRINLDFDVFGSLPSKPIIFDFSGTEKIIKGEENLQVSIKIKGCEWKQVINVTGINSISSNIWSNYSFYNLSLSISDISVLFNVEDNLSSSAFFDTLKIQKSKLILPQKKSFTFNTRNLYTDTISSYADFSGKIITNEMTFLDTQDPVLIQNFQSPIEIKNHGEINNAKREALQEESNDIANNFQYTFCLSTKDYNDRAFEDSACEMHSVPHDYQHYISVKNTDIAEIIKEAPSNNIIRFYLTGSNSNDPCSFILPQFENDNHTLLFQVADPDVPTYLTLKGSSLAGQTEDNNVNVTFHTVSYVNIDTELLQSFRNVTLRSSQLVFADDKQDATIQNLVTDSLSISQFSGTLTINQSIELRKTTPRRIKGSILMANDSAIIVPQMSNFPVVLFKESTSIGKYSISLCDADEHIEMRFYFDDGFINVALSDNVPTVTDSINLTFRNDANNFDRDKDPEKPNINITTFVPAQGINATFGASGTKQWPCRSVFTFENLNPSNDTDTFPLIFLTILDGSEIKETNAEKSIFMYFYKLNICLLSYSSFGPFIHGVNKKNDQCPAIKRPHFAKPNDTECYQAGTYDIGYVTLDIFDILRLISFEDNKIWMGVEGEQSIKFPSVSNFIVMLTTSDNITYESVQDSNISKTKNFQLQPSKPTTVTFGNSFVDAYRGEVDLLERLSIVHNAVELNLKTLNREAVPRIVLDDKVQGVHIITVDDDSVEEYYVKDDSYNGSWIGPDVEVKFSNSITVPQTAFLADTVSFIASSAKTPVNFIYYNKSVADYKFTNTFLSFTNSNSSVNVVNASAKSMTFVSSSISQNTKSVALNLEVESLTITDLSSIPASSFSSPIIIHKLASIEVPEITKIVFSPRSVKIYNGNVETATLTHIPSSSSPAAEAASRSSASKILLEDEQIPQDGFYVKTPTDKPIDLEVSGSSIPDDFQLKLTGDNPTINLGKSFNNINVPDTFEILSDKKYNINTDLRELPNGIGEGAVNTNHSKQKLTNNLGFIIFIIIFAVIFVVAMILCVIGLTCMPQPEQYDVSTDGSPDILDYSTRGISEKKKVDRDGEMDASTSNEEMELPDIEEEKKENDQFNEVKDDQVKGDQPKDNQTKDDHVEDDQAKPPESSYSVEIEQEDETSDDVDGFFDNIDKSSSVNPENPPPAKPKKSNSEKPKKSSSAKKKKSSS